MRLVETTSCPVCHGDLSNPVNHKEEAKAADTSGNGFADFRIKACAACGHGFTSPVPAKEDAGELYATRDSANYDAEGGGLVAKVKDAVARGFIRRVAGERKLAKVLDYSCGNGRYGGAAKAVFPDADVTACDFQGDPPPNFPAGVRYLDMTGFAEDSASNGFDLIILRHVLEHSYEPVELLKDLGSRLSPNGILYIETPNLNCSWAALAGKHWPGFYAPFHVWHFTKATLESVVRQAGLSGVARDSHMPMIGNTISQTFGLKEGLAIKAIGASLFPLQWVSEALLRNGSAIHVRARAA